MLPELASIRIAAYEDSNSKLIGHRILPVVGLCPGYRHVNLRNEVGQPHPTATLFLHIVVKDYVPDGFADFAEALANPIKYQSDLEKRAQQLSVLTDDMEPATDGWRDENPKKPKESAPNGSPTHKPPLVSGADSVDIVPENDTFVPVLPPVGDQVVVNKPEIKEEKVEEFVAEPLDKIMENKQVKDKKLDLDKKLESLRKKHEKKKMTLQTQKSGERSFIIKIKKRVSKSNL